MYELIYTRHASDISSTTTAVSISMIDVVSEEIYSDVILSHHLTTRYRIFCLGYTYTADP
jgi:hypothetical protein